MIDISDEDRQRTFSIWLRTGRLPALRRADGIELKFNPWHDPATGRFTFAGSGGAHGGVGRSDDATGSDGVSARGSWTGGGFTGGGGGSVGGGGASTSWKPRGSGQRSSSSRGSAAATALQHRAVATGGGIARPATTPSEPFRTVVRNGYTYRIDARDRTRNVSGALTVSDAPVRSRTVQARAGGADRRPSDDGGHYIAARFNGPTEAFNHFAQDANFNRGTYRLVEDQWARAKRAGSRVTVRIIPIFSGRSARPSAIDVSWAVDGSPESQKIPNERSENSRGKR